MNKELEKTFELRYSELDCNLNLKPYALFHHLQDIASDSAEKLEALKKTKQDEQAKALEINEELKKAAKEAQTQSYEEKYARFKEIYPSVKQLYKKQLKAAEKKLEEAQAKQEAAETALNQAKVELQTQQNEMKIQHTNISYHSYQQIPFLFY